MSQSRNSRQQLTRVAVSPLAALASASLLFPLAASMTEAVAQDAATTTDSPSSLVSTANLSDAYVLGAGDQIQVSMYGQNNLFPTPYTVLVDGSISLPFIGRMKVGDNTISQAQVAIAERYKQFFKRPFVTVVLLEPRDIKVNIAGEVIRPGPYPIPQSEQSPTVASLIKLAGGHTQSADLQKVQIRRPRRDGTEELIVADVMRLLRDGDGTQNPLLRDGDTVVVLAATQPDMATSSLLGQNSLTPDQSEPLNVAIVGEVYRPGPYVINSSNAVVREAGDVGTQGGANSGALPTVSQAIQRAGGIKPQADIRRIQVRRLTRFGTEQILEVDLWKLLQEGDLRQDVALQSKDTIIVPVANSQNQGEILEITESTLSPETIGINVVGEVRAPGLVRVRPNTPLSQAVMAAGGFDNSRANKKSVDLIRLAPDGTVSQRRIELAFNGKIDEETNPALKNNDVVVIRRSGLAKFGDGARSAFAPFSAPLSILRFLPGL
ncbi:MAG: SLBB domain-containing protein [Cyanobacteria bacterium P01_F01_bin.42]